MRIAFLGCVVVALMAIVASYSPVKKGIAMSGSQTKTPGSASNDATIGSLAWLGLPGNIQADDATQSTLAAGLAYNASSQLCVANNFSFDQVPDDAAVVSVKFRFKRKAFGSLFHLRDSGARLVLAGVVQSTDYSLSGNWPTTAAFAEYTVSGLTPAQVKDSGFGFALAAKNVSPDGDDIPSSASPAIGYVEAVASW